MSFELFSGVAIPEENKPQQSQEASEETVSKETPKVDYTVILNKQRTELLNHIHQLKIKVDTARSLVQKAQVKIEREGESVKDGISLLQIKNHCLAEYIENIAVFCSARATGSDVAPSVQALCTNRTVIEKMKPLEKQLQHQFDKWDEIEKHAATKTTSIKTDTSNLRPNISRMLFQPTDDKTVSSGMVSANYIAPEIMSAHYPKASEDALKESRYAKSSKARTHRSALLDEAASQYLDTPEELGRLASQNRKYRKAIKEELEMEKYEIENFHRVQRSKKHNELLKQIQSANNGAQLNSILDYGHIASDTNPTFNRKKSNSNKSKK